MRVKPGAEAPGARSSYALHLRGLLDDVATGFERFGGLGMLVTLSHASRTAARTAASWAA
jgi:hypothetical protein